MSGTAPTPMAPHPSLQGATSGMGAAPPSGNPVQAKFQAVVAGMREVLQIAARLPGADQAKVKQATEMFRQGAQLLAQAVAAKAGPQ